MVGEKGRESLFGRPEDRVISILLAGMRTASLWEAPFVRPLGLQLLRLPPFPASLSARGQSPRCLWACLGRYAQDHAVNNLKMILPSLLLSLPHCFLIPPSLFPILLLISACLPHPLSCPSLPFNLILPLQWSCAFQAAY